MMSKWRKEWNRKQRQAKRFIRFEAGHNAYSLKRREWLVKRFEGLTDAQVREMIVGLKSKRDSVIFEISELERLLSRRNEIEDEKFLGFAAGEVRNA